MLCFCMHKCCSSLKLASLTQVVQVTWQPRSVTLVLGVGCGSLRISSKQKGDWKVELWRPLMKVNLCVKSLSYYSCAYIFKKRDSNWARNLNQKIYHIFTHIFILVNRAPTSLKNLENPWKNWFFFKALEVLEFGQNWIKSLKGPWIWY